MEIRVAKRSDYDSDEIKIPTRKHPKDAGMDFYAHGDYIIKPQQSAIVFTGVMIEIPKGYAAFIWPKSKSNYLIGAGVIDEEYQGEILVKVCNVSKVDCVIADGDPVAQVVLIPVITPEIVEVSDVQLHNKVSSRGETGGIVTQTQLPLKFSVDITDPDKTIFKWD